MVTVFEKILDYFMVLCLLFGSLITNGAENSDLNTIGNNIVYGLVSGNFSPFASSDIYDRETIISKIETDNDGNCRFADVDYKDKDRASWLTARYITRTEQLAILYRRETDEEKKDEYREYVLKLLDHWIKNDYQNSNWWHNKLSNPNILGEIGLLMKDDLSKKQLVQLGELVGRGCFTVNPTIWAYTGANVIDLAMSSIKFGALMNSSISVKTAVNLVGKELKYSKGEGLHADGTFFQHGNRLYMGGYGVTFINGMANIVSMLSGTEYIFTSEQLSKLAGFITDGLKTMSFGSILDPTTMGRSVSRYNAQPLPSITRSLRALAGLNEMPRKREILDYINSIESNIKTDTGLHYFEEAKFIVINNSDFYFSFKGGDSNLLYAEIINDENILGYNSSFPGVTTIMHSGNEYNNISPVNDFSTVPGTTAVSETDEQLRAHSDFSYRILPGVYGDAQADGAAVSFAKTEHEGIKMTVACFATDNGAYLLGTGFSDSRGRKLTTTINQTFLEGEIKQNGSTVTHNGIKYTLLEGGELTAKAEHRTGSWQRNNLTCGPEPVEGDVFTLSFENSGSYAYSVMSESTDENIKIICNTDSIQAIELPDGRVASVFYKNGSFEYNGKTFSGKAGNAYISEK